MQMAETVSGSNGKLCCIIKPRIEESTYAMHFEIGDQGIPVAHRTPRASPGVLVEPSKSECIRYHRGGGHVRTCDHAMRNLLRVKSLAVEKKFGIKLSRPPTIEYLFYGRHVYSQEVRHRL